MIGLEEAQKQYDKQQPNSYYENEPTKLPFSDKDVEFFITELAQSSNAINLLENFGCMVDSDVAAMLQEMAVIWTKNSSKVYAAAGTWFWRVMHSAALEQYNLN